MSADWPNVELSNLATEITVGFVGSMTHEYVEKGVPFFRSKNIDAYEIDWNDIRYVSETFHKKISKSTLRAGDVAIVRTGKPGTTCVIPEVVEEANCSDLVIVRVDENKLSAHYLAYFMNSVASHQVSSRLVGAVQQHFNVGSAKKILIPLPSRKEQERIVDILKSLDDKIRVNRQINQTLEQIAQTIFKSWFVDFEPVKAKIEAKAAGRDPELAAMCAISGKLEPDLDQLPPEQYQQLAATAALFPDELVESELGLIPVGWEVLSLGEVTSYLSRGISPKYTEDGGVLVLNQKCIRDNIVDVSKARRHNVAQRKIEGRELLVGDILVNSTGVGTLGRVAQILDLSEPTIIDSHVTVVRAKRPATWNYLGLALLRRQDEIEQLGEGSTGQTELNRGKLAGLFLNVPSFDVLQAFDANILPLRQQFASNLQQTEVLATLRDTLLPKLLAGELAVENLPEEATA